MFQSIVKEAGMIFGFVVLGAFILTHVTSGTGTPQSATFGAVKHVAASFSS